MAYDYTSASDLVSWCKEQKNKANAYRLGGIGRYENGVRIFDCVGLIKCFMWHDYSEKNASYYNKEVPDKNETGFFNEATEKGSIDTIPEIPGLMVYQPGHIGVYLGNGQVIEATAAFDKKIVITYFKGNHPDTSYKRTTWTYWFKMPYLTYDAVSEAPKKTNEEIANEVINGAWGNGQERKDRLTAAGYDYSAIQEIVNQKLAGTSAKKSNEEIAEEVIAGKWGNGSERKKKLTEAGYDYSAVQSIVNKKLASTVNLTAVAKKVYNGDYGNGQERKDKLKAEGYTDAQIKEIQSIVNKMCA